MAWRAGRELRVAPNACPHMGASLAEGPVRDGRLVCPWHGLELGTEKHGAWCPLEAHDDGVLCWVRLDGEDPTPRPIISPRPSVFIDSVMHYHQFSFTINGLPTIEVLEPWHTEWQNKIGQRDHLSHFDILTMSFLYPPSNWRFLYASAPSTTGVGTFHNPYQGFRYAESRVPAGGRLVILYPDSYDAVGVYSEAKMIEALKKATGFASHTTEYRDAIQTASATAAGLREAIGKLPSAEDAAQVRAGVGVAGQILERQLKG